MEDTFSPRTVATVALSSLVGGFVAVFGGWMLLHRPAPAPPSSEPAPPPPALPAPPAPVADAATTATPDELDAGAPTEAPGDGGTVAAGGAVNLGALTVSRCWAAASPAVTPGAACDRLVALEQHFASRAAQIAGCATGHGRLALVVDFRVSTNFARAWGGPTSTIGNAGVVAACVRRVTAPLPITTMPHQFDRYIVNLPIEW